MEVSTNQNVKDAFQLLDATMPQEYSVGTDANGNFGAAGGSFPDVWEADLRSISAPSPMRPATFSDSQHKRSTNPNRSPFAGQSRPLTGSRWIFENSRSAEFMQATPAGMYR
jgi:hypothetical protein